MKKEFEVEYVTLLLACNSKYTKDYDKIKGQPCLKQWDVNNLYGLGNVAKVVSKWFWVS